MSTDNTTKTCSKCKQVFPATTEHFPFHKRSNKLYSQCWNCKRESMRKLQQTETPEQREHRLAYGKQWASENQEHIREYRRDHDTPENRAKAVKRAVEWQRNNKEKFYASQKRYEGRFKMAEGSYTEEDIARIFEEQDGLCAYCGIRLFPNEKWHIDHYVPLSKGGTNYPDNLFCVCPTCNAEKADRLPDEWLSERNAHVSS